jgi:hypothetical protein
LIVLDYHGGCVSLSEFKTALAAANFPDPAVTAAKGEALAAVSAEDGRALLGAFVHHLLGHAASDGAELNLLERAAKLWTGGSALFAELGVIRADLVGALDNPGDPGAADRFNTASVSAQNLAHKANELRVEVNALRLDALKFPHLPEHPRQQDRTTDTWDWGNLALARRTDAFVRELFRLASDQGTLAFAVGAAAAYGANVAGSAYVSQTVGGPRRTLRHRDRIARNAVGGWLAANHPAAEPPSKMADRIALGGAAPALPTDLETLIKNALDSTFDTTRTLPIPEPQIGYARLVQHLRLLDAFVMPEPPSAPPQTWMAAVLSDPHNPPPSLRPQNVDVSGKDGGGVGVTIGNDPSPGPGSPGSSDSSAAKGCGIAIAIIILLDLLQAFVQCIGQWADHHKCTFWDNMLLKKAWEEDPPDPRDPTHPENPQTTAAQLTAISSSPQTAQLVWMLFDTHNQIWEAMGRAYEFLALTGLIYPGNLTSAPLYAQFTTLPGDITWPHRGGTSAETTYHLFPSTPLENPTKTPSPFPAGVHPDEFLRQGSQLRAADVTLRLWRQIAAGEQDSQNLDLDADRGFEHPCWAARNSVQQDPVDVVILPFGEQ